MALTDIKCKSLEIKEKSYKISDEKGLRLLIHKNGSKYWQMKYYFGGKEKLLSFGVYPEVTLKEARNKRDEARKQIADNLDPSQEKKLAKLQHKLNSENSFENIARQWHEHQKQGWTQRHANYVLRRLEVDIFKEIGFRPINEITPPELLSVLRSIEARDAIDIAKRLLQTCGQIFRYGVAIGVNERDITADLKGALKVRKRKHHNKLEEDQLPEFLEKLENYDGDLQTQLALKLLLLTFVRTTELRAAKWQEFNFENKEWHIPAERMKMRQKHIVPLSKQAIEILKQLKLINENREYLFPNRTKPQHFISENTMLYAMYRMGYHSKATPHGLRATASTILNEKGFNCDHIERQLAHGEKNKVRASYNHAQYLPERHKLMQWWADYLDKVKK